MKFEEIERKIIEKAFDLDRYLKTLDINSINSTNKEKFDEYQKNYDAFYKIRRDENWRKTYFDFLEKNKNNKNITFEKIITYLYNNAEGKNIEASFSSKMLATINQNKPIWDSHVLEYIFDEDRIKEYENKKNTEKLEEAIKIYKAIEEKYKEYLNDKKIKKVIKQLRKILKEEKLSDTKILDYIIWTQRKDKKEI